ncbi:exocyst complex component 3-like protein 4 [Aulostomus maculatus]
MSEMTERSADEDRASIKSNGRMSTGGAIKETFGRLQTSIRRAAEKSPFSPRAKGSKVTSSNESGSPCLQAPASPSLSSGSPMRSSGGFSSQMKGEDDATSPKVRSLMRSKSDPNMTGFGDSLLKRGQFISRSLKFGTKKDKEKTSRQEPFLPATEGSVEDREEMKKKEEEEEVVVWEEMETYTLPDLPHTPLSVMQINKLIEMEVLEEAHLNLLALRQEVQLEWEQSGEDSPVELAKKEKDLNLLYGDLRSKLKSIVCTSNSLPSRNKGLLVHVACIIQEEEKRAKEPGGLAGSWMEAWREAVSEGVKAKLESVHLEHCDQSTSWLAVHLGLLGKAIVEDLEGVQKHLRWSYPPSFDVFSTYVRSYHAAVRQHLKTLEQQVTELKDLHALLNWIINSYKSERIMGHPSLQPNMKDVSADLQLEDNFLLHLREKYCCRVKEDMRSLLGRVIELEAEDMWTKGMNPEKEDNFLNSVFHMDIWIKVKGNVVNAHQIDAALEKKVTVSCLEELEHFPKRFEMEFRRHSATLGPESLRTEYQITYINTFAALLQHMEEYQNSCPAQVEGFRREVRWLIARLMQALEDQFKEDVEPYLRRMMRRKWLTIDDDFQQLRSRTELLSQNCHLMRPPHVKEMVSQLHYHVVKEYVGQLMKKYYSCKNRKHEKAARKMHLQLETLRKLFEHMGSTHEWLHSVGEHLSNIIGQKNETDIKNHLQVLVEHYPDFSKKHLVAVLNFRGLMRGHEYQLILQRFSKLKKTLGGAGGNTNRVLFGDMVVTVNPGCLSSLPFSCLSSLLPDN